VSLLAEGYSTMVAAASHYAVETFVKSIKEKITRYIQGKRVDDASKSDLADFNKTVAAIANDLDG
jgi:hypothetical protein